ncbi:hypothetical protein Tco_0628242 [Tanacetum coccineum]|uniref:Uncharacterized protein n=1 Tax=Tanacetum coccineum TaxID=301880 RepID=A0ABQ4WPT0_9ASTR
MEHMTSICDMVGQIMQKKEEKKRIAEEQAAKDRYWKIPICYDDDEDYTIAITPVLSTKEPVDSLIIEDEHLDTICICLLAWMGWNADIEGRGLGELCTYDKMAYTKVSSIGEWENSKRAAIDTDLKQIEYVGRVVVAATAVSVKGALSALSSFGRDHYGNTFGSWIAGAVAVPVADGAHIHCYQARRCAKRTGTPPHDVIDIVARTIVTTMGAHKNETTNLENEPFSSELAARDTKATAKRPLLPQPLPEAKKKKGD